MTLKKATRRRSTVDRKSACLLCTYCALINRMLSHECADLMYRTVARELTHRPRSLTKASRAVVQYSDAPVVISCNSTLFRLYVFDRRSHRRQRPFQLLIRSFNTSCLDGQSNFDTFTSVGFFFAEQSWSVVAGKAFSQTSEAYENLLGPHHSSTSRTINNIRLIE